MAASRSTKVLSLLAVTAALAIAGCGGDDETTSSTTTGATGVSGGAPLSQEEFVSQANAICADANSQIAALPAPSAQDLQTIAEYAQEVLAIADPLLAELQALVPPEDLQSDYSDYTAAIEEQADLDRQIVTAAEAGDTQQVQSILQQLDQIDNDQRATALGLDECAQDPEPQG